MAGPLTLALEYIADLHHPVEAMCPLCHAPSPCRTQQAAVEALELTHVENLVDDQAPTVGTAGGVSMFDGAPFVHLRLGNRLVGQFPPDAARQIAAQFLDSAECAESDAIAVHALRELKLPDDVIGGYIGRCRQLRISAPWVNPATIPCAMCGHLPGVHAYDDPAVAAAADLAPPCQACPCAGYIRPGGS